MLLRWPIKLRTGLRPAIAVTRRAETQIIKKSLETNIKAQSRLNSKTKIKVNTTQVGPKIPQQVPKEQGVFYCFQACIHEFYAILRKDSVFLLAFKFLLSFLDSFPCVFPWVSFESNLILLFQLLSFLIWVAFEYILVYNLR